ncbi:peroxidase family protein [Croceiramulus getboli]|nr:heme peroxidase family protein [Flavobacteriaceae bacterium YJPT1-3]
MSTFNHHGMKAMPQLAHMCAHRSLSEERIGRFGRIFHGHAPLFLNPKTLIELGKKSGPMDGGTTDDLTQAVPLGMVYFGQFIDHDITLDTTSSFGRNNQPGEIENFRTPSLDLDCIFGEGPEDEPFLYEADSLRLLTGATNNNLGQGQNTEKHDLPRNGEGRALIGDPRNDENRIVSQLQLAFIRFYNELYNDVAAAHPDYDAKEVYEEARRLTTWHYQWIVVNEFLPVMCGEVVVDRILGQGRTAYQPCSRAYIPVEFSVGSYRFGHSMITQKVQLNNGGSTHDLFSNQVGGGFSKITSQNQVIDWERFFDFDGTYQRAAKLDIHMASTLLELPFIQPPSSMSSLATRNLMRGQSFLLPSGETIARCLNRDEAEINQIKTFLKNATSGFDIDLDAGTPLWLYILAEAGEIGRQDKDGFKIAEGLGPVGATLTAEVILALLELDPNSYLGANRNWQPDLGTDGVFTMKDLLEKSLDHV